MKRTFRHIATILPPLIVSLLIFAVAVNANAMIGITRSHLPFYWGWWMTSIVFFVIVFVEALVFWRILPASMPRAFMISVTLNLISALFGFFIEQFIYVFSVFWPIIIILLAIVVYLISRRAKLPLWISVIFILCIMTLVFPAMMYGVWFGFWVYITLAIALFSAFGITLYAESWTITWMSDSEHKFRAVLVANIISYILLAAITFGAGPSYGWYIATEGTYTI